MKLNPLLIQAALLAVVLPAAADTFVLKDGTQLQGTVLREDATNYLLEVQVTKSIKDERTVAKTDVREIRKGAPVPVVELADIRRLVPTPDELTAADYEAKIRLAETYMREHKLTSGAKEASAIRETLAAEAAQIKAGAIKLGGKMISAEERQLNSYDIDANIAASKIHRMIKKGQTLQALRAFAGFERDFPNTSALASLTPVITQLIKAEVEDASAALKTYEARTKARRAGLAQMTLRDREVSTAAIREQNAELKARFEQEKSANVGWVTRDPFCRASLEETITYGNQELARLAAAAGAPPAISGGEAFRQAMQVAQAKGDPAELAAAIATAKSASVPKRYLRMIQANVPKDGTSSN